MQFDNYINKIKNIFAKKEKESFEDDDENNDLDDNFDSDLGLIEENEQEFDEVQDMDDFENNETGNKINPELKKKIIIGSVVAVVGLGFIFIVPSFLASLDNTDETMYQEMQQMQQEIERENQEVKSQVSPLNQERQKQIEVKRKELELKKQANIEKEEEEKTIQVEKIKEIEELKQAEEKVKNIVDIKKITKTDDLIKKDNTEDFLSKINVNSNKIKDIVDSDLNKNMSKSAKELSQNIDPFLLESMVVIDNNYHKKVMLSQVEMMKEFMKYLDIKKKFDDSVTEYKEGKVKNKTIEDKILEELTKLNLNSKLSNLSSEINGLKDENDKLKYLLKQKIDDIDNLNLQFKSMSVSNSGDFIENDNESKQDYKLSALLDKVDIKSLNIYSINNRPIAEIMKDSKYKVYKEGDIFDGFKIKSINMDGLMLSYVNSKGIERTKFINITKDLNIDDDFDVLQIPEAGFSGGVKQEIGESEKRNTNQPIQRITPQNTNDKDNSNDSVANRFLQKLR